jgi:uncharacterized protein (DUF433 family)
MPIPKKLHGVLASDPEYHSGAVRFAGTRVPVQALLDTLAHKLPVSDFLEGFPNVTEAQAYAVVEWEQNQARLAFELEPVAQY